MRGWIIDFELGKLAFQRRRYWDADDYLRSAESSCPPEALFEIRHLRFINLSWLTSSSNLNRQPMLPEAIDAGLAALEVAEPGPARDTILLWLAGETKDYNFVKPVLAGEDEFSIAQAHELVGNTLGEVSALLACVDASFTPRAFHSLIGWFARARLFKSADYLTEVALKESAHSFFDSWELATTLLNLRSVLDPNSAALQQLSERIQTASLQLQQLSRSEFQHLIRTFEFFSSQNRDDLAELILTRAARLAEGTDENLKIAIARRPDGRYGAGEGAKQGLDCLVKAEREASRRIDRLHAASEYCIYGHLQKGRQILEKESAFDGNCNFNDFEYVAALKSGGWLDRRDFETLAKNAFVAAAKKFQAGIRRRFESLFLQRLYDTVHDIDSSFAEYLLGQQGFRKIKTSRRSSSSGEAANATLSDWDSLRLKTVRGKLSLKALEQRLEPIARSSPAAPLVLWSEVLQGLESAEHASRIDTAHLRPEEVPISRSGDVTNPRSVELHNLWRAHFGATSSNEQQAALDGIRVFEQHERQLLLRWKRERYAKTAEHVRRERLLCQRATTVLAQLRSRVELGYRSPVMRQLEERVAADVLELTSQVRRRQQWLERRLREDAINAVSIRQPDEQEA